MSVVYQLGDLVGHLNAGDDLVGIILELRVDESETPGAKVLWSGFATPRWSFIESLRPVQPDGRPGITPS
ncbi:MAG: hypothetical protein JW395_0642 [Nitrospira sp.]|nr:hypothetical protein [Nitrospira sp.]